MLKAWIRKDIVNKHSLDKFYNILKLERTSCLLTDQLLFFSPLDEPLSKDGYFEYLTPRKLFAGQEFIRRLWIGGSMKLSNCLHDNQEYTCHEKLLGYRNMGNSTFITLERIISQNSIKCISELRHLLYTNTFPDVQQNNTHIDQTNCQVLDQYLFEEMDIIRYCQLSLNPHRIHWDRNYSMKIEKYKNVIVPGPFSLQLLLAKIKHNLKHLTINNIKYKHINIIYPNVLIDICHDIDMNTFWIRDSMNNDKIYVTLKLI